MSFARRVAWVAVLMLGCRMDNPGFDDVANDSVTDERTSDESTRGDEVADSSGEGVDTSSSSATTSASSSDGVDTSSSSASDAASTSEGVDTSSSSSTSSDTNSGEETSSSTDGMLTDGMLTIDGGLDAPINNCPLVAPADSCMPCMQNSCCMDEAIDMPCFNNPDSGCYCVLTCLAAGLMDCGCQADLVENTHAQELYLCGMDMCADYC